MVSSVFGSVRKYGEYGANFLLGTGSSTMGGEIAAAIKGRKANNIGLTKAIGRGFKDGFIKSNAEMKAAGGFFKNLGKTFSTVGKNMKTGWKEGAGFFSKLGKSIKPLGKLLPFAMNALWLASYIPDIVKRTKDEGIWGGIKETGKALTNMAVVSLACAVAAPFGVALGFIAPVVAGMATNAIIGQPYSVKKAEAEEAAKKQAALQTANQPSTNPFQRNPRVGQRLNYMAG